MYPEDVNPESGCRLPLPCREQLDDAGQRTYDSLADPKGGTIRGLRGPGGILLHSPQLSRHARPLNLCIDAGFLCAGGVPYSAYQDICVRDLPSEILLFLFTVSCIPTGIWPVVRL
jgi:hypothetical protein